MLSTTEFIEYLDKGEIPPSPPILDRRRLEDFQARGAATKRGMWALVYKDFARELAAWIGDRKVLEVMAGRGWLAKALSDEGIEIVATDDNSWDNRHSKAAPVFPVRPIDAVEAVLEVEADVLIMSWPPYGDEIATRVLEAWGESGPIVYIGEGYGGCNAPDSFFQRWRSLSVVIPLASWDGLHDGVDIGYYVPIPHHVCKKCEGWASDDLCWRCEPQP